LIFSIHHLAFIIFFMSTVIRASERNQGTQNVAFNFEDLAAQSDRYLAKVRAEALQIVAKAQKEAEGIRRKAEQDGRQAAMQAVEAMIGKQLATVIPALRDVVQKIQDAKQSWLRHWEAAAVRVSGAIAAKLVRREIGRHPEITLDLVREALILATGSSHVRIHLNPNDLTAMGDQMRVLLDEIAPLSGAELDADPEITPGGCRVDTRFGIIDQQFEAQLKRIEEELTQ
jgi:flagellar biosynthesis/type III secretory pathway protein FliH